MSTSAHVERGAERMRRAADSLPQQFVVGAAAVDAAHLPAWPKIERVVHCGMGGSAFPADLVRLVLAPLGVALTVSRAYQVECPGIAQLAPLGPSTLVLVSSFSGNTEETLASYDDARRRGATVVGLAHGGSLAAWCRRDGVPLIELPKPNADFQPRAATGYFVGAIGAALEHADLWPGARKVLAETQIHLESIDWAQREPEIQRLSAALEGQIPVIYATSGFAEAVARVAKIKFNENAKVPAFWNRVPEFNHNEMVGYTQANAVLTLIFLKDPQASPLLQRRIRTSVTTLRSHGLEVLEVALGTHGSPLARAFETLMVFDRVTIALAIAAGLDPNPVEMVEAFKAALTAG